MAVIVHEGRGINSGHYVAYCYNALINKWIHCNDARVSVTTEQAVRNAQAYILFYAHRQVLGVVFF